MIDEKYIVATTTTYTIKYRQHSFRVKENLLEI